MELNKNKKNIQHLHGGYENVQALDETYFVFVKVCVIVYKSLQE